ncbi:hypothetical protein [Rhizobium esperanzae]|uniref:Endonuclease YncB(Thermonuclease family) n=1 Tax=Rhizobium esperanzae TaxID=1967781 RepID=A0A7W6W551_9HYPH|nr:hypothetical protein [Rhizobium esperanzae]MBB4235830.1 endonuclease YncB(thermonuclease family) [Rhizobium esperanzae]
MAQILLPFLLIALVATIPVDAERFVGRASVIDGDTIEIAAQRIQAEWR